MRTDTIVRQEGMDAEGLDVRQLSRKAQDYSKRQNNV